MTIYVIGAKDNCGRVTVQACSGRFDAAPVLAPLLTAADEAVAERIAVALGTVSAYAWAPAHHLDKRDGGLRSYPTRHLEALAEPGRRAELRGGTHSVWYELCCLRIEEALEDLDEVVSDTQLRDVVRNELRNEADGVWGCLPLSAGGQLSLRDHPRSEPLLPQPPPYSELGHRGHEAFTRLEDGVPTRGRSQMVDAVRLLYDAQRRAAGTCEWLMFDPANLSIYDHGGVDGAHYTVTVTAPTHTPGVETWLVRIHQQPANSTAETPPPTAPSGVRCELGAPPTARQLTDLFESTRSDPDRITALATTPTGADLDGTSLTVTGRG